jgi:hypothetical protein
MAWEVATVKRKGNPKIRDLLARSDCVQLEMHQRIIYVGLTARKGTDLSIDRRTSPGYRLLSVELCIIKV